MKIAPVSFSETLVLIYAPISTLRNGFSACVSFARGDTEKTKQFAKAAFHDLKTALPLFALLCCTSPVFTTTQKIVLFLVSLAPLFSTSKPVEVRVVENKQEPVVENKQSEEPVVENKQSEEPVVENKQSVEPVGENKQAEEPVVENKQAEELVVENKQTEVPVVGVPVLSEVSLAEVTQQLLNAEFLMADLVLRGVCFFFFAKQVNPDFTYPWNGYEIAEKLAALPGEEIEKNKMVADLKEKQKAIDHLREIYQRAGGTEDTLYDVYQLVVHFRKQFDSILGETETNLINLAIFLNDEIALWEKTKKIYCEKLPYTNPINGHDIIKRISEINLLKDNQELLENVTQDLKACQNIWENFRRADLFLQTLVPRAGDFFAGRMRKEDESVIKRKQPSSFIDFNLAISRFESGIFLELHKTNVLLETIRGDTTIAESIRKSISPIPFSCPLDLKGVYEKLNIYAEKLSNSSFVEEIKEKAKYFSSFQTTLDVFRQLHKKEIQKELPSVYGDQNAYLKVYREGGVKQKVTTEAIMPEVIKALEACDVKAGEEPGKPLYNEFKSKVVMAKEHKVASHPFFYLGLKEESCTVEDLKAAQKKFAMALHPDRNRGVEDAKPLFDLMNQFYEICMKIKEV